MEQIIYCHGLLSIFSVLKYFYMYFHLASLLWDSDPPVSQASFPWMQWLDPFFDCKGSFFDWKHSVEWLQLLLHSKDLTTVCHSPCQTQRETAFLCYNAHKYNRAKPIPLGDPPVMGRRCLNTLEDFSLCVFMFLGSWLLCTTALNVQGKQPFAGGVTWQCCFQRCRLTADISIQLCWAAGLSGELN